MNKIEKLVYKLGQWSDRVWTNNLIVMNPYSITAFKSEVYPEYQQMDDNLTDNARKMFDDDYDKELEIPTVQEIKEQIRELCGRKQDRVMYYFGNDIDLPVLNARYLLVLLEGLDVTEIKYKTRSHPVMFVGKNGTALLLPIHVSNVKEKGVYLA